MGDIAGGYTTNSKILEVCLKCGKVQIKLSGGEKQ